MAPKYLTQMRNEGVGGDLSRHDPVLGPVRSVQAGCCAVIGREDSDEMHSLCLKPSASMIKQRELEGHSVECIPPPRNA